MRKLLSFVVVLFMASQISAQAQNKEQEKAAWPELIEFHSVLSKTFHPAEEGNLKPAKQRIAELVEKAKKLSESKAPAEYGKQDLIFKTQQEIFSLSLDLDKLLKYEKDTALIMKKFNELHDAFHRIAGMCKPEKE